MTVTSNEDVRRLRTVSDAYRRLILFVGVEWLLGAIYNSASAGQGQASRIVLALAVLGVACVAANNGYSLAQALGLRGPVLWLIGMFLPVINLICLLVLSRRSQAFCRARGIRVGLLGPDPGDLAKLEQAARAARAAAGASYAP